MCEFCEKEKQIISSLKQFHDRIETVVVGISENKLKCSTMIQTAIQITPPAVAEMEIDFCPKCGRKISKHARMTLVEYAEKMSPIPLSERQKQFLTFYEQTKRENKRLLFVPTRISGRRMLMQIIQEFEKEQAQ